ncbi:MAG: CBS domain-containing protein, partial [Bacteroidia bacterium]
EKNYLGVITLRDVVKHLAAMFSVQEEGTILVLSVQHNNYSVSEIGRIVESANARILSLYINEIPDTNRFMVTLKINVVNPERVVAAFERFSYEILMSYFRADAIGDYKRNLDMLFWMIED